MLSGVVWALLDISTERSLLHSVSPSVRMYVFETDVVPRSVGESRKPVLRSECDGNNNISHTFIQNPDKSKRERESLMSCPLPIQGLFVNQK